MCYYKSMAYKYYNPNPSRKNAGDCVIRALCAALGESWQAVYTALSVQGYKMHDWGNSDPVWGAYLRSRGFVRRAIDELMGILSAINPRLYNATLDKIEQ